MLKRAYICAHANFPRNGAEANYICNLARCLKMIGYRVTVISRGHNYKEDWNDVEKVYIYQGIYYNNIDFDTKSLLRGVYKYLGEGDVVLRKLKDYPITGNDYVFLYSINFFCINRIYKYAKRKGANVCTCVVEHNQSFQYKGKCLNPVFWMERLGFRFGIPISKKVIVISRYLQNYFKHLNCETFILPSLVDFSEYRTENKDKCNEKVCNIIYSGNPFGKDDMNIMIHAVLKASLKNAEKIKFHITGCNEEKIIKNCDLSENERKAYKQIVRVYPWMEYNELIKLYRNMDFFLLARHQNKVTLANFPSKVPELMACGIIPIVSEVGDYTELYIKNGENGIVFQKCSVDECVEGIERAMKLTEEEKSILSYNAQKTIEDKLDYRVWGEKLEEFL